MLEGPFVFLVYRRLNFLVYIFPPGGMLIGVLPQRLGGRPQSESFAYPFDFFIQFFRFENVDFSPQIHNG